VQRRRRLGAAGQHERPQRGEIGIEEVLAPGIV
jgi:hypothetical protein